MAAKGRMNGTPTSYKQKALVTLYLGVRYYAAFMLLSYGFAKVMGAQFTVLDSQLAKPMGEVSGFWLTWYYFGYSAVYSSLVAWTQILGAMLLCFGRTALIGALLLLPVMVNILGIDLWVIRFPLTSGALQNAIYVFLAILVVVAFHGSDVYRFLLKRREDLLLIERGPRWRVLIAAVVTVGMTVYTAREAHWLANVNNRVPTPIDGAWKVVGVQPANSTVPEWIFFEYNRAYMVVFQFSDGKSETHDFRVDSQGKTLNISGTWLSPGSEIFHGDWSRSDDRMTLQGSWGNQMPVLLTLERKQMPVKDHQ